MRLIQDDGEQIGIVSIDEARERAEARGMDLVEVAADARPPVVKMMDYGKVQVRSGSGSPRGAQEAARDQGQGSEVPARASRSTTTRFKVGHAKRFLEEGNKVKLTMMFRGRQVTHPEIGMEVLSG